MFQALAASKKRPVILKATAVLQDSVLALKPVDGHQGEALEPAVSNTKIRKARKKSKTQSRRKTKKK